MCVTVCVCSIVMRIRQNYLKFAISVCFESCLVSFTLLDTPVLFKAVKTSVLAYPKHILGHEVVPRS